MVFKFTIDTILDPYIPRNQVHKLPRPLAHLLGHHKHPRKPAPDYLIWLEILISTFAGLSLIMGIFKNHNVLTDHHHAPMILASYGASAILCFNASQAPLAQPRNVFFGHFISAVIGMGIQKLFGLSHYGRLNYWASGALSVAVSSVVMAITNTVHPPAGASALLPSIDDRVRLMSWWFLPLQVITAALIITVALITGNVIRTYPVYWWSPGADVGKKWKHKQEEGKQEDSKETKQEGDRGGLSLGEKENENESGGHEGSTPELAKVKLPFSFAGEGITEVTDTKQITITSSVIEVPEYIDLDEVEVEVLRSLQQKLMNLEAQVSSTTNNQSKVDNIV